MKKKMTNTEEQKTTELNGISTEFESKKEFEELQTENRSLKKQLNGHNRNSTLIVSIVFAVPGILSLIFSITAGSQVLAFVGLGLTFWGALFYLVRPVTYVRGNLLSTTAATLYQTIDRIIKDLDIRGKAIYVPPYSREANLPQRLKGLKETVVFLPKDTDQVSPPIEEMATGKFMTKNPRGIIIIPPGSGYLDQIEKLFRTDITKMTLEDLCTTLPQIVLENFQLAKDIEMKTENNQIHLKTTDSIYRNLYDEDLKTVKLLGDPLTSAIACTVAKTTGKQLTIETINITPDSQTLEATFQLIEG